MRATSSVCSVTSRMGYDMRLTILETAAGFEHMSAMLGADISTELGLAELLRAEITARGTAPRAATLERIGRLIAPIAVIDPEPLARTCEALVREGDLVLAAGGVLAATPVRLIRLAGEVARVVSSLPTVDLRVALDVDVERRDLIRQVPWTAASEAAVAALGGVVLTPEKWAGLDRAPLADDAFLLRLDQRLAGSLSSSEFHGRDEPLEWRGWTWHEIRGAWRRDAANTPLWRAQSAWRGFVSAWTAGASPSTAQCFELAPDDAVRARFALSHRQGHPLAISVHSDAHAALLKIPGWLPRAEHRWLSLHAEPARDTEPGCWQVPAAVLPDVLALLKQRLGVAVEET